VKASKLIILSGIKNKQKSHSHSEQFSIYLFISNFKLKTITTGLHQLKFNFSLLPDTVLD